MGMWASRTPISTLISGFKSHYGCFVKVALMLSAWCGDPSVWHCWKMPENYAAGWPKPWVDGIVKLAQHHMLSWPRIWVYCLVQTANHARLCRLFQKPWLKSTQHKCSINHRWCPWVLNTNVHKQVSAIEIGWQTGILRYNWPAVI